jgi:hypothetical protein
MEVEPRRVLEFEAALHAVGLPAHDYKRDQEADDLEILGELQRVPQRAMLGFQRLPAARHGVDLGHRGKSVVDLADKGTPYAEGYNRELMALAMGRDYPAHLALTDEWTLLTGAFRHCAGPT